VECSEEHHHQTTHLRALPTSVTILRRDGILEGRVLASAGRRATARGVALLAGVLPDGALTDPAVDRFGGNARCGTRRGD